MNSVEYQMGSNFVEGFLKVAQLCGLFSFIRHTKSIILKGRIKLIPMRDISVTWFEIPVSDIGRASKFYEKIFDVTLELFESGPLEMAIFPNSGVGGALVLHEFYQPGTQGPVIYLNGGEDLQIVLNRVEESGGHVVMPKKMISEERGYMGLFSDTEGNRIALHSYK